MPIGQFVNHKVLFFKGVREKQTKIKHRTKTNTYIAKLIMRMCQGDFDSQLVPLTTPLIIQYNTLKMA